MNEIRFNFSEAEEIKVNESKPKRIKPGIHEVEITGVRVGTTSTGLPRLEIGFINANGETHIEKFSLNSKVNPGKTKSGLDITMSKIKHIGTKVVSEEEINNAKTPEQLNALLTGKKLRIKFCGEEFIGEKGKSIKTIIGNGVFAESLDTNPSKLKFDENNIYDIRRIPDSQNDNSFTNDEKNVDDLPF
jgi:hypothetical protein